VENSWEENGKQDKGRKCEMLEAIGIKASYKGNGWKQKRKEVLKNINFKAESGQCIGLIGANGAGKSTLLSILSGIRKPDNGQLVFEGKDLFLKENRKLIKKISGYVPQENPLIEELTVFDNLMLWYFDKKRLQKEIREGKLVDFGLEEYLKVPVNKLSGGLKKRVSIACAVADNPKIMIMDEPTAALDMLCKHDIMNYIHKCKNSGKIIIFSTHDETELQICDRLYVLRSGELGEVPTGLSSKELVNLQK